MSLVRRTREIDWKALGIAFVVLVFLLRGEKGEDGGADKMGIGIGNGEGKIGMGIEPAYVIAIGYSRSAG